jgi:zinc protease
VVASVDFSAMLAFLPVVALALQLPTVQQVLDRSIRATGGRDALLRHQSMTIHDRSDGVETVTYMKGTKAVQKVLFPNGKTWLSGYDGTIAWSLDTAGKVTLPQGDMIKTIARDADMYYHLHVLRYFRSMTVVDVKLFNGRPCYHLKGVNNWGKLNEHFYDTTSGLLLGYAFNTAWRGGKGDATQTFEDYKDFGGVLFPTKITGRDGDDVSVDLITSVTYDDVDDAVLTPPAAVLRAARRS